MFSFSIFCLGLSFFHKTMNEKKSRKVTFDVFTVQLAPAWARDSLVFVNSPDKELGQSRLKET